MAILVTGGTGYIGSHTVVSLIESGFDVVICDNLSNSKRQVLDRIYQITSKRPRFYEVDCTNYQAMEQIFKHETITDVIHFAGYKAVGESVEQPLKYYYNNINSTLVLLELMKKYHVYNIVFSSSATVYINPTRMPLYETDPVGATSNPYGTSKYFIERILEDFQAVNHQFNIVLLRYFNPIGAHESGLIGEDPEGIPNNLMPYITQVAIGKIINLAIFGADYDTKDGTGVRDYLHVCDLAIGHIAALNKIKDKHGFFDVYNLGTGKGTSVLEMILTFEQATGIKIAYVITSRRPGDMAISYANCDKAEQQLNWKAKLSILKACEDSWRWQKNNPQGFE